MQYFKLLLISSHMRAAHLCTDTSPPFLANQNAAKIDSQNLIGPSVVAGRLQRVSEANWSIVSVL